MRPGIIKDILKCIKLALFIVLGICLLFGGIYLLFYSRSNTMFLNFLKNSLYYIGCFGLLISTGFLIQKNANRDFDYQEVWNKMFCRLNLGFVILFVSLFICLSGMAIQLFVEARLL